MTTRTMTGMFNSHADTERTAQQAVGQLGVKRAMVRTSPEARATGAGRNASQPYRETGVLASIRNLLLPDEDRHAYAKWMRRGGVLVSEQVGQNQADQAADILEGAGAVRGSAPCERAAANLSAKVSKTR